MLVSLSISYAYCCTRSDELRSAVDAVESSVIQLSLKMAQSTVMYEALQHLASSPASGSLTTTQKRVVELCLQDARLSGIGLESDKKTR